MLVRTQIARFGIVGGLHELDCTAAQIGGYTRLAPTGLVTDGEEEQ